MSHGVFSGVPVWIVLTAGLIVSAAVVVLVFVNGRRIGRGKRPL